MPKDTTSGKPITRRYSPDAKAVNGPGGLRCSIAGYRVRPTVVDEIGWPRDRVQLGRPSPGVHAGMSGCQMCQIK